MNKHLLLSRIKGLIFVLKSSTEYNTDFIYSKKGKRSKFLLYTQNIYLNGFNASTFFKIVRPTYYFFCSQESTFSIAKEIFLDQGIFPQPRKFSLIKEISRKQGSFPQQRKFSTKNFPQKKFPQTRKFSTKLFFFDQESFHKLRFLQSQKYFL